MSVAFKDETKVIGSLQARKLLIDGMAAGVVTLLMQEQRLQEEPDGRFNVRYELVQEFQMSYYSEPRYRGQQLGKGDEHPNYRTTFTSVGPPCQQALAPTQPLVDNDEQALLERNGRAWEKAKGFIEHFLASFESRSVAVQALTLGGPSPGFLSSGRVTHTPAPQPLRPDRAANGKVAGALRQQAAALRAPVTIPPAQLAPNPGNLRVVADLAEAERRVLNRIIQNSGAMFPPQTQITPARLQELVRLWPPTAQTPTSFASLMNLSSDEEEADIADRLLNDRDFTDALGMHFQVLKQRGDPVKPTKEKKSEAPKVDLDI
jgi:hypothetical protein